MREHYTGTKAIDNKDVEAIKQCLALGEYEYNTLRPDFQDSDVAIFLAKAGSEHPILSDKNLELPISFATTCRCQAGLSTTVKVTAKASNRLDLSHTL